MNISKLIRGFVGRLRLAARSTQLQEENHELREALLEARLETWFLEQVLREVSSYYEGPLIVRHILSNKLGGRFTPPE